MGGGGVKLETFCVGGRRYTTAEAFARFVVRRSAAQSASTTADTNRQRQAAISRAEQVLRDAGV